MPKAKILIELVDRNGETCGLKEKRQVHQNPVPLHRAISVVIFDNGGKEILIQKRAGEKPTWPGFWSNTICSHPLPKESYQEAAARRLKEEMGIMTPLKEAFYFIYQAKYNRTWGEHELDHVFVGRYEGKIRPDPKEAADYRWLSLKELKIDLKKNPKTYTPWFKMIVKKLGI